jgi:hypothetical protein
MSGFDIIGDVHGCADKLRGLLKHLGYRELAGTFHHAGRQAIFVGDLIDRGPQQIETVQIARSMVDAGAARVTMGNHEFTAIPIVTPNPGVPGDTMRTRRGSTGAKNLAQHATFLRQVGDGSVRHSEFVEWFKTLPLWLDLERLRIAHACWHQSMIETLAGLLGGGRSLSEFVIEANTKRTVAYEAVETILKGPEVELGGNRVFVDKDGHDRTAARIRWWDAEANTLNRIAEIPAGSTTPDGQPFPALPEDPCPEAEQYRYLDKTPVFFGHYWRTGVPKIAGPAAVCVDFSAGTC